LEPQTCCQQHSQRWNFVLPNLHCQNICCFIFLQSLGIFKKCAICSFPRLKILQLFILNKKPYGYPLPKNMNTYCNKQLIILTLPFYGKFKLVLGGSWFDSHNENQLTPLHVRIGLKFDLWFSHEWKRIMRTSFFSFFFFLKNWIDSFNLHLIFRMFHFRVPK
jgi:hypothetical protein